MKKVKPCCGGIAAINERLAKHGAELQITLFSEPTVVTIATTHKTNTKSRRGLPLVVATFCPFCGTKYKSDTGPLAKLRKKPSEKKPTRH